MPIHHTSCTVISATATPLEHPSGHFRRLAPICVPYGSAIQISMIHFIRAAGHPHRCRPPGPCLMSICSLRASQRFPRRQPICARRQRSRDHSPAIALTLDSSAFTIDHFEGTVGGVYLRLVLHSLCPLNALSSL